MPNAGGDISHEHCGKVPRDREAAGDVFKVLIVEAKVLHDREQRNYHEPADSDQSESMH